MKITKLPRKKKKMKKLEITKLKILQIVIMMGFQMMMMLALKKIQADMTRMLTGA